MPNVTETADVLRLALNVGPLASRVFVEIAAMGGEYFGSVRCLSRLVGERDVENVLGAVSRLEGAGLLVLWQVNTTGRNRLWAQLTTPGRW